MRRLLFSCVTPGVLGVLALGLASCGKSDNTPSNASAPAVIKIGDYESMSGSTATFGQSTHKGVMLAMDAINASGGVLGKQVQVVLYDDAGSQEQAITVVKKLVDQDQVCAVLGEVASSNSIAAGGVCQDAKVPMVSPSSTNPIVTQGRDYVFRVCFTDDFQGAVDARFALKKGWKKIAVFTCNSSDYSKKLSEYFVKTYKEGGGTITSEETYNDADKDYKSQLTKMTGDKANMPDAVYLPGYYTNVVLILRQARDLGIDMPFAGGDGWDSDETLKLGKVSDGCYFSDHYSPDEQRPEVKDFISAYEAKYAGEVPDAMAITGYDAARVLADAIKRAGSDDSKAIRDALAQTKDFHGASGIITIDENRNAKKPIVMMEILDGKTHLVDTIAPE